MRTTDIAEDAARAASRCTLWKAVTCNLYARGHCPSIFVITSLPSKLMSEIMRMRPCGDEGRRPAGRESRPRPHFVPTHRCPSYPWLVRDMTDLSWRIYRLIVLFSLCETRGKCSLIPYVCATASTTAGKSIGRSSRKSDSQFGDCKSGRNRQRARNVF